MCWPQKAPWYWSGWATNFQDDIPGKLLRIIMMLTLNRKYEVSWHCLFCYNVTCSWHIYMFLYNAWSIKNGTWKYSPCQLSLYNFLPCVNLPMTADWSNGINKWIVPMPHLFRVFCKVLKTQKRWLFMQKIWTFRHVLIQWQSPNSYEAVDLVSTCRHLPN